MSPFDEKKLDLEIRSFVSRNFEKPHHCKNLEQIRFYISELCHKIEEYRMRFNHVPNSAYALLAQYNARQNSILNVEFSTR